LRPAVYVAAVPMVAQGQQSRPGLSRGSRQRVSQKEGVGRNPYAFAELPRGAHQEIKPDPPGWDSGMRLTTSSWKSDFQGQN
jgi:hypothetical protein